MLSGSNVQDPKHKAVKESGEYLEPYKQATRLSPTPTPTKILDVASLPPSLELEPDVTPIPIKAKVELFIKIYLALRAGQNGFFKTNWVKSLKIESMQPEDAWRLIQDHSRKKPNSRTADAMSIMNKNAKTKIEFVKPNANALFNDIYCIAFKRSGFFKKSAALQMGSIAFRYSTVQQYRNQGNNLFDAVIRGSRREKIHDSYHGIKVAKR